MEDDLDGKNIIDLNEEIIRLRADNKKLREILKRERELRLKMTKVLVVDDSELMQDILLDALMEFGFQRNNIGLAGDGQSALDILSDQAFNLIISDWHMPGMTGLEFIKRIRANPELFKVPFLMMTSEVQKENVLKAASSGVDQYMVKPFENEDLKRKILALLK
jgi:two-component system, chemotaxis family, chemotaxis protein CheY